MSWLACGIAEYKESKLKVAVEEEEEEDDVQDKPESLDH